MDVFLLRLSFRKNRTEGIFAPFSKGSILNTAVISKNLILPLYIVECLVINIHDFMGGRRFFLFLGSRLDAKDN